PCLRTHRASPLFPYTTLFRSRGALFRVLRARRDALPGRYSVRRGPTGFTVVAPDGRQAAGTYGGPVELDGLLVEPDPVRQSGKRSEEHTSELQSRSDLVCRLL